MRRDSWGGLIAVALLVEGLGGCAHGPRPEPKVETVEVKVPVPVPCKVDVGPAPSYADDALDLTSGIYDQVKALLTGREQRKAREKVLTGAVEGCGGSAK
jgi:hypothetical protein